MSARQQRSSVVARPLGLLALAYLVSSCGSSSISVTSPTGSKCSVALTNSMTSVPAAGASAPGCGWTAASAAAWIKIAAGSNGTGSGTVTLNVLANGGEAREGTVIVAGQTLTVTQPALGSDQPTRMPPPTPNPTP